MCRRLSVVQLLVLFQGVIGGGIVFYCFTIHNFIGGGISFIIHKRVVSMVVSCRDCWSLMSIRPFCISITMWCLCVVCCFLVSRLRCCYLGRLCLVGTVLSYDYGISWERLLLGWTAVFWVGPYS